MTKTNEEIQDILLDHTDDFLIECAQDLQKSVIPEESPLRVLEIQCYGSDGQFLIHIMGLGCLMTSELARRLELRNDQLSSLKDKVRNIL